MKKFKLLLPLLAITAFVFTSCSDDDDETTALQRLQNKWLVDSLVYKNTAGGVSTTVKYTGSASDYFDFKTDNLLYFEVNSTPQQKDTVPYSLIGNTTLVTNVTDTSTITLLTSGKLATYRKTGTATNYQEEFGYFRR